MYFKNIEMRGFKSFVDETKLAFEPGVTVVVGPNGCGKSNIADGIRWVLGEQSAKIMRGAKMEDFIFNGSSSRKPAGYAEVSLTISNAGGMITTQPYAGYDEITVTRKLYRSGESEYYINKVPCRLKDIVDVFLDTGVSIRAFSIIEQGQVTKLVNSKPEERRFIIEEAAGVMKYKYRRNAAINKLEASQTNLLRIQDILGELERQRNSLNRQAKKAERYKEFRSEIRTKALVCHAHDFRRQTDELTEASGALEKRREDEANLLAELSTKRNEAEIIASQVAAEERDLSELREERQTMTSSMERNDDHKGLLTRQLDELAQSNENALGEIGRIESEITGVQEAAEVRKGEIASLSETITGDEGRIGELRRETDAVRGGLGEKQAELSRGLREAMGLMERISAHGARIASVKARIENTVSKLEGLGARENEINTAMAALKEKVAALKAESEALSAASLSEMDNNSAIRRGLEEASAALKSVEEELSAAEKEITRQVSRLESLEELERNMEGFSEGVRRLMKRRNEGASELSGVKGLLADGLRVTPELEAAVGAILGERLEAVIVESAGAAMQAVSLMKRENIGRSGFVPMGLSASSTGAVQAPAHPKLVGRAVDMVTLSGDVPQQAAAVLANILIASDLTGALEIWNLNPGSFTVVTPEGDMVDRFGFVTGGSPAKAAAGGAIVARKRMIEEIRAQLTTLEAKKDETASRKAAAVETVRMAREKLAMSDHNLREIEMKSVSISREMQREESELARGATALESLMRDRDNAMQEQARLTAEELQIAEETGAMERRKEELDAANGAFQTSLDELRGRLDEMTGRLGAEEVKLAESRGRLENLRMDLRRLESSGVEMTGRIQRLRDSISGFGRRRDEIAQSTEKLDAENVELARKRDTISASVNQMADTLNEKIERRAEMERSAREIEKTLDDIRTETASLAVKKSELEMRIENLLEKADHEFNIPVEDLRTADIEGLDVEEAGQRLAFLRGELSRIGDVNMSALEEYEEVNGRFEFMKNQHEDLVKSIATLRKTIDSINATTADMFNETYEKVSRNFEIVFKRLFGGGRAEMRLTQEEGQSEPGLEIFVQPPGKKVQNLNLLSAGEKAMTAIALLFAVFMTRPSPFCLLDEVDAPLDEANIFRFRDMLMEMKANTQFIIITHNQKTMSFAERLYGITQEEEGVSKILSVDLVDKHHEDFELTAA
ncbi:MAG: chromosome segregation protein SMC [Nitrospinae bacterium]|nr:chromosome segregation protein SMC [Nitrospinota bacterium]